MIWIAAAGRSFLLFAQKKRTKEKGTPCVGLRLHCVAFFVRETHQTRYAQTGKSLILTKIRYSSTQKGSCGAHLNVNAPVALMRSRASQSWSEQHDGCLTEGSFRHARPDREAQGTRRASMGWPFLVRFLATQKMNSGL